MSDIPYDDLCNLIAIQVNHINGRATPRSVDYYLKSTYKVILDQLRLNNRVYIKDFGIFEIKDRKSGERIINNPNKNNEKQKVFVKPRKSITFKASKKFDVSVNENNFKLATDEKVRNLGREHRKELEKIKKKRMSVGDLLKLANKRKEV